MHVHWCIGLCTLRGEAALVPVSRRRQSQDKANFYTVGIKRRTDHEVGQALDDIIYRTLLAPSPDLINDALDTLRIHLEERNQWRTHARGVVERVANVYDGGPSPPVIARVMQQINTLAYPTGQVKRSLDCY